jgi:hypothetical protein
MESEAAESINEISRLQVALEAEKIRNIELRSKVEMLEDQLDVLALENERLRKLASGHQNFYPVKSRQIDESGAVEFLTDLQDGDGLFARVLTLLLYFFVFYFVF